MALFNFHVPCTCARRAVKGPISTYLGSESLTQWQFLFLGWTNSKSSSSAISKMLLWYVLRRLYNVASLNWCPWKLTMTVDSDWLAKAMRYIQNQTAWVPVPWQWAQTFSTGKVIRAVMGKITILFRVLILCYFWKLLKFLILSLMWLSV